MGCFLPDRLYGVTGWPLAQSLSPLLHNTGFQSLGLSAIYMAWPVPPDELATFLRSLRIMNIQGISVTIPHKIAIIEYLDKISEAATLAGAVNTLYWMDGCLCGDNTDVTGFMAPLTALQLQKTNALILGAGGAAHAVASGLKLAGWSDVRVTSPGGKSQYALAERFGYTAIPWDERYDEAASLLINATPMGMHGPLEQQTPYDFKKASEPANCIAYDLVYNPLKTVFLREAAAAGCKCISGLEMFFGQGNAQFRLWTGEDLPPAAKSALYDTLGAPTEPA